MRVPRGGPSRAFGRFWSFVCRGWRWRRRGHAIIVDAVRAARQGGCVYAGRGWPGGAADRGAARSGERRRVGALRRSMRRLWAPRREAADADRPVGSYMCVLRSATTARRGDDVSRDVLICSAIFRFSENAQCPISKRSSRARIERAHTPRRSSAHIPRAAERQRGRFYTRPHPWARPRVAVVCGPGWAGFTVTHGNLRNNETHQSRHHR